MNLAALHAPLRPREKGSHGICLLDEPDAWCTKTYRETACASKWHTPLPMNSNNGWRTHDAEGKGDA
eukprot:7008902-Pyramimonas_sp.AAC.1